ncbi:phosphoheptose isomerase [Paramagnetospirillum kuznetsovii]|uniref:Phosphoheptose isomerase n=1 Tax=Paramagnetospirillum kuznetsovii TaxID=2053833 RepID=A0A364P2I0_9PROT|nr:D-sedoheptulose 7-phosphate isomerase [Paramagnetospirillum kuznetsovii]RAU23533.1 phosphoheptose isomerase [Paramagnetospirillum kuznetsovii]
MEFAKFLDQQFAEHAEVVSRTAAAVREPFQKLVEACLTSLNSGGKILFFGNGGSAADAQHLATELVVRYRYNRKALASIALTTDTSLLTACANDFSFEEIFSRQIEALGRPGDVAIGITTSGNSPNVLTALAVARDMGLVAAGFGGRDGGKMVGLADPLLIVPSNVTARIQEMHILLGHALCDQVEAKAAPKE